MHRLLTRVDRIWRYQPRRRESTFHTTITIVESKAEQSRFWRCLHLITKLKSILKLKVLWNRNQGLVIEASISSLEGWAHHARDNSWQKCSGTKKTFLLYIFTRIVFQDENEDKKSSTYDSRSLKYQKIADYKSHVGATVRSTTLEDTKRPPIIPGGVNTE